LLEERIVMLASHLLPRRLLWAAAAFALLAATQLPAQGPAPESAPPLFPGGGLVSFDSLFTNRPSSSTASGTIPPSARPTFSYQGDFFFVWGFHPNFDFALVTPIFTNHFQLAGPGPAPVFGGTDLGDITLLVKYRFHRRDSERGTTQASVTVGPKLPTGRTGLRDDNGAPLPPALQPGSGSADVFLGANWTCTGLFHVRRLVADEDFRVLLRTTGVQSTRLGSGVSSRFWLSYRPYQSKDLRREWFFGPALTWRHFQDDRIAGVDQQGSGGDELLAGIATYLGLRPGLHARLSFDWDFAHSSGLNFQPVRRIITFGITQQFRLGLIGKGKP
jgi:hypothetical protein